MLYPFNAEEFVESFTEWISEYFERSGASGTIQGLSGGIDSAVVAALMKNALGDKHKCLFIDIESSSSDLEDAKLFADKFGIELEVINLNSVYESLISTLPEGSLIARANLKPRLRMISLYYYANNENRLVIGTGNKTEFMVGYFTKHGDGAADLFPIGDLYKTQVRELARYLGIPERIIVKPPSAGLWSGQTDEGELGITYDELDRALYLIEKNEFEKIEPEVFRRVTEMINRSEHKRTTAPVFKFVR